MTNRRTVLKCCALATTLSLAGCLGDADSGTGEESTTPAPTDTSTPEPTGNATTDALPGGNDSGGPGDGDNDSGDAGGTRLRGTGGPGVTIVRTDEQDGPVEHAVELVREAATEEAPPGLRVSVTNTGEDPLAVGESRAVVFAYRHDTEKHLLLLPSDADREYPAEAGCWRLTDGIAVTQEYRTTTLAPGETTTQALDLYGAVGEDACLPVGEYRFETSYQVRPATEGAATSATTEDPTTYSWGFTVLLE
ncbi:hypothetical protein ACFPYI_02085 [Halomarina salina]|uniref:Intracellular proteinase inhibitor BsuPI domain-containing protein n=1 Tax=Halomarina salina TaxID=1872699 RepID=A0ABD5RI78_9EURY|nr:hypothetical protein [Halomarina salina]